MGTGRSVAARALSIRNSRSTACAEGRISPAGFLRRTSRRLANETKNVGFDWPPLMRSRDIGPSNPEMTSRRKASRRCGLNSGADSAVCIRFFQKTVIMARRAFSTAFHAIYVVILHYKNGVIFNLSPIYARKTLTSVAQCPKGNGRHLYCCSPGPYRYAYG